ncbi:Wzz/FepE/Etk N-terminal domain-containing protein [SAR86 cluster bacterium]|nr:Wzz/FepE/Etk N-terminal domain-containing protein [SAR86 cluster bacterium]
MNKEEASKLENFLSKEIDLREIIFVLWNRKFFLISLSFLFSIISIFYSLSIPNKYTSESILEVQSNSSTSGAMSSIRSQFGGIASLAGINLGSGDSGDKSFWVMERIKSKEFSKHIYSFPGVVENFFAVEKYDPDEQKIFYNEKIFKQSVWQTRSNGKSYKPTFLEFHAAFNSSLDVQKNTETGFIDLKFEHFSPKFSEELLNLVINEINVLTKEGDKNEATFSLEYLQSVLGKTLIEDTRLSINELIKTQLNIIMLADVKDFYILKPIDLPFVPESKSSPSRSLIVIMWSFFGFLLSSLYILVRHFYLKK